ncbi:MAG: M24 family metallopeptidase [Candidatus Geothermarchaeales archaeon]
MKQDFPREEYDLRCERARELMAKRGLDALFVTGDQSAAMNYRYLSGHLPRDYQANFNRPHILILPREGDPALIVVFFSEKGARNTSWVKDIRSYAQPFTYEIIKDTIKDLGLSAAKFGAELGEDQRLKMPLVEFQKLRSSLPMAEFVDASDIFWKLRMIKSPRELEYIRKAHDINGRALDRMYNTISEGTTEIEAIKKLVTYMVEEGAYRPPHSQLIINSGPEWGIGFWTPRDKPLRKGDIVFIDSGCVVNGYWGEFSRMGVVGSPSERQRKNHETVRTIVRDTISETLRPGVKASDIVRFYIDLHKQLGLDYSAYKAYVEYPYMHLAHGIGLCSSEPPYIGIYNEMPLEPGMFLSTEAYLHSGEVYGTEEGVLITEDGCEIFSEPDKGLYLIK